MNVLPAPKSNIHKSAGCTYSNDSMSNYLSVGLSVCYVFTLKPLKQFFMNFGVEIDERAYEKGIGYF